MFTVNDENKTGTPVNEDYLKKTLWGSIRQSLHKPSLMHILLMAVIVFFAAVIIFMSTSLRAVMDGGNKNQKNNNESDKMIATEDTTENETEEETSGEIPTAEHIETPSVDVPQLDMTDNQPEIQQITVTTTTEPVTEVVTVTVIKEVIKEVPVEVPVQKDDTDVYSGACYACVTTQKDPLNIRSGAGKSYKVIGSIPKGKYIDVYMTSNSQWYYTTYGGVSGYVSADYITLILSGAFYGYDDDYNGYYDYPDTYNQNDTPSFMTATVKTNGGNLYLRDAPSMNGNILTKMPNGTVITVIAYDTDWCYVEYNGTYGYSSTDYLSF